TELVKVGRWVTAIALLLAVIVTPAVASMGKLFSFIQEYTGFVTPGVLCIFLLGLFWKRTTSTAALWSVLLTIPISVVFKLVFPELAFLDRMMLTFLILIIVAIWISLNDNYVFEVNIGEDSIGARSSTIFNIGALVILVLISVFYIVFW
ncbi:MAG: sodium/glucose cotransporter, partial [Cyclobacteriaceae bacterium]|nr:sodium/glucose cotransporter [Cyclobacteriaceae bacterium]